MKAQGLAVNNVTTYDVSAPAVTTHKRIELRTGRPYRAGKTGMPVGPPPGVINDHLHVTSVSAGMAAKGVDSCLTVHEIDCRRSLMFEQHPRIYSFQQVCQ